MVTLRAAKGLVAPAVAVELVAETREEMVRVWAAMAVAGAARVTAARATARCRAAAAAG